MNLLGLTHLWQSGVGGDVPRDASPASWTWGGGSPELSARSPEWWDPEGYVRMRVELAAIWLQQTLRGAGPGLGRCAAPGESGKVPFPLSGISLGLVVGL